ncbi:MAG: SpvB/TcaC N-terminal domain-containing protein [Myxococcota bacterium]
MLQAPPKLEIPKGGGAIRGIGEKFQANAATGTAGITVPIALSPGRNGFQPGLALSYNSGAGNGPFGLGWSLAVPSIRRKTDKGLPEYHDADDSDVFVLSEAEDLVPMRQFASGSWSDVTSTWNDGSVTWEIRRYRPRVEGAFARIERWTHPTTGDVHWRTISRENVTRIYGKATTARLADPDDAGRVFEWFLEEERDEVGNVTTYEYDGHERDAAVAAIYERNRETTGNGVAYTYLKRVYYGNVTPFSSAGGFYFEVVLDYGDHTAATPTRLPDTTTCPSRQDVYSSYRSGFDVRCYRLCERVLLFHRFSTGANADATLVRATEFAYDESGVATTLTSITVRGYRGTDEATLPAVTFGYAEALIDESVQFVEGIDDLPQSLDISRYQWVDLDGEGLTGLLTEQGGAWYYKRNDGGGALGAMARVGTRPGFDLAAQGARLMDVDGDGRLEFVRIGGGVAGYHARGADGGWEGFRSFRTVPAAAWQDANTRMLDLDGDGLPDLLVTENDVFTWYPSAGTEGWAHARRAWRKRDEEKGPTVLFASGREAILLADMNGDGLTDLVRVRNGSVCYWPNKGYGRFGAKVQMANSPRFDAPDRFDPGRIRLGDIDGAGPADLVYLGPDRVRIWWNESGNGFGATPQELAEFPGFENTATVTLTDLLANGTQCLVWSSPLLRDGWAPLRYIELMAAGKPYLLTSVSNGLGRTTTITYAPSTEYYVNDRTAGTPWATRLPFPVQCVQQVEVADAVTGWRFVTTYAYHHGYFDGAEREFRGFGMVEQRDAETLDDYDSTSRVIAPLVLPPVVTKTWFHTGAWKDEGTLEEAFEGEYFVDTDAFSLDRSSTSDQDTGWATMTATERREAARALKGRMLRQEVYAEDGDLDQEALPYVVSANNYTVVRLQAADDDVHPVFRVDSHESVTWHYERDVSSPMLPRVQHALTLAVDEWGNVTRAASVSYAKRNTVVGTDPDAIAQTVVLVTEVDTANDTDGGESGPTEEPHWHVGVACAQRAYELTVPSATIAEDTTNRATVSTLQTWVAAATRIDWDGTPSGTTLRLLSHKVTSYYLYTATTGLGGETFYSGTSWGFGTKALVYQKYARAFVDGFFTNTDALGDLSLTTTELGDAGYVETPGDGWWVPSGTRTLDTSHFFVATTYTDPFGNATTATWDTPFLFVTQITDALPTNPNVVTAEIDYTALQPDKVTDPNGNWTEVTFDALGRVLEMRVVGKNGEGDPSGTVTTPTASFDYHLNVTPAYVHSVTREKHGAASTGHLHHRYAYCDGGGSVVQVKVTAEPDPDTLADRWVGTGRVVLNNKGLPVKQYQPFFSSTSAFEYEDEVAATGITPILYYDPPGRVIRVELPNGTLRKVEFTPWTQKFWDENDSINDPLCTASATLKALAVGADTPCSVYLDVQGRVYATDEVLDGSTTYTTEITLDVVGRPEVVTDARGIATQTQSYDLLGRPMKTKSPDAGDTVAFLDVAGQPIRVSRSGSLSLAFAYDELRRRTTLTATETSTTRVVEVNEYGEGQGDALNHKGRLYRQWDTAGRVVFDSYDFKGNLLQGTRRYWDYAVQGDDVDWTGTPSDTKLESEEWPIAQTWDALNRVVTRTTPDDSVTEHTYNEAGLLETVGVRIRGAASATPFVEDINYNARGQRTSIEYGNGVVTEYTYETDTLRLSTLVSTDATTGDLQELAYTYDPVGNIREIANAADDTLYFNATAVTPNQTFAYDALYRLIEATGREKASLGYVAPGDEPAFGSRPDTNSAVQAYTQSFDYDQVGNITQMVHFVGSGSAYNWTRDYTYATDSNHLEETSVGGTAEPLAHDDRGNIVYLSHLLFSSTQAPNIEVDYRDLMKRVQTATSGEDVIYFYDAGGQRVRKVWRKTSQTEERFYFGGAYEVYRRTTSSLQDERETVHVMDGEQRIAMIETLTRENGMATTDTRQRYQLGNHLGTSVLELTEAAAIISYEEYHPYGTTAWQAPELSTVSAKRYRYSGKERDEETGLYYHGARYLAPWLGRWASPDPIGVGDGVNRYAFVHGNPVGSRDPSGMSTVDEAQATDVVRAALDAYTNNPNQSTLGDVGEVVLERALQGAGLTVIKGPTVSKGAHKADIVAFDPETGQILFFDNKIQLVGNGSVRRVGAFTGDGAKPQSEVLQGLIDDARLHFEKISGGLDSELRGQIQEALDAVTPDNIQLYAANASHDSIGNLAKRLGTSLTLRGNVGFLNIRGSEHSPAETRARISDARVAKEASLAKKLGRAAPNVVGLAITGYMAAPEFAQAREQDIEYEATMTALGAEARFAGMASARMLTGFVASEVVGELGGAAGGAVFGLIIGALLGVETGPGAVITGLVGALIGGYVGSMVGEGVGGYAFDLGFSTWRTYMGY